MSYNKGFDRGLNARPGVGIYYHINDMNRVDMDCNESQNNTFALKIEGVNVFATYDQLCELHRVIEGAIYDESFDGLQEKLLDKQSECRQLEDKIESLIGEIDKLTERRPI